MSANAQTTTPFETVFDACKKACEALDGGFASGEQLLAVSKKVGDSYCAMVSPSLVRKEQPLSH